MDLVAGITLTFAIFTAFLHRGFSRRLSHLFRPRLASGAVFPFKRPLRSILEAYADNVAVLGDHPLDRREIGICEQLVKYPLGDLLRRAYGFAR